MSWYTARQWTQAAHREGRVRERLPEGLVAEVAKLRQEIHQLRDTNELLKAASDPVRRYWLDVGKAG